MLDGALRKGDDAAEAWWTVPERGPWIDDGRLIRSAFIEIAAQAAAAHGGIARVAQGLPLESGRLGAADAVRIHADAAPGDRLDCDVTFTLRYENLLRAEFRIRRGGSVIAEGHLTLAVGA